MGIPEKIKKIEDEMSRTPINKGTERHLGVLKARLARLRDEMEVKALRKSGRSGEGYTSGNPVGAGRGTPSGRTGTRRSSSSGSPAWGSPHY